MTRKSRICREIIVVLVIQARTMVLVEPLPRATAALGPASSGSATANPVTVDAASASSTINGSSSISLSAATQAGVSEDSGTITPYHT